MTACSPVTVGLCSPVTCPCTVAPAGMTVCPFCATTAWVVVAVNLSPTLLDFVPSDWSSRAVMVVPAGSEFALAGVDVTTSPPEDVSIRAGWAHADTTSAAAPMAIRGCWMQFDMGPPVRWSCYRSDENTHSRASRRAGHLHRPSPSAASLPATIACSVYSLGGVPMTSRCGTPRSPSEGVGDASVVLRHSPCPPPLTGPSSQLGQSCRRACRRTRTTDRAVGGVRNITVLWCLFAHTHAACIGSPVIRFGSHDPGTECCDAMLQDTSDGRDTDFPVLAFTDESDR